MAKRDWKALQQEYKLAFDERGISIKAWCDENGINYNTARRYLQVISSDDENPENCAKNAKQPRTVSTPPILKRAEKSDQFGGSEGEKPNKSKGKGRKKKVISESDQLTDQNTDQFTDHSEKMEFIRRFLGFDMTTQRDEKGRFVVGNQLSVIHNGYTARLKNPDAAFDASQSEIDYEIAFARAKLMETIDIYYKINADLEKEGVPIADRVKLYELRRDTDANVDRALTIIATLLRTKAQVKKTELESARIEQESAGLGTAIADIVQEIQAMESDGFVLNA